MINKVVVFGGNNVTPVSKWGLVGDKNWLTTNRFKRRNTRFYKATLLIHTQVVAGCESEGTSAIMALAPLKCNTFHICCVAKRKRNASNCSLPLPFELALAHTATLPYNTMFEDKRILCCPITTLRTEATIYGHRFHIYLTCIRAEGPYRTDCCVANVECISTQQRTLMVAFKPVWKHRPTSCEERTTESVWQSGHALYVQLELSINLLPCSKDANCCQPLLLWLFTLLPTTTLAHYVLFPLAPLSSSPTASFAPLSGFKLLPFRGAVVADFVAVSVRLSFRSDVCALFLPIEFQRS